MWPGMLNEIFQSRLTTHIDWDIIIDSTVVKMQKPDRSIYEYAQLQTGALPEEILFIDNTAKHLVEPLKMGWQTFLYDSSNYAKANRDLLTYLQSLGL